MIRNKVSKCEGMDRVEITSHLCISASNYPPIGVEDRLCLVFKRSAHKKETLSKSKLQLQYSI